MQAYVWRLSACTPRPPSTLCVLCATDRAPLLPIPAAARDALTSDHLRGHQCVRQRDLCDGHVQHGCDRHLQRGLHHQRLGTDAELLVGRRVGHRQQPLRWCVPTTGGTWRAGVHRGTGLVLTACMLRLSFIVVGLFRRAQPSPALRSRPMRPRRGPPVSLAAPRTSSSARASLATTSQQGRRTAGATSRARSTRLPTLASVRLSPRPRSSHAETKLTCVLCACGHVPAAQPSPARRSRRPTATTPPGRPARCPAASLAPAPPATAAR